MKIRILTLAASIIALAAWAGARGGVVSPRGGGPYPEAYREIKAREKGAFTLGRAWKDRLERQRAGDPRYRLLTAAESPLLASQRALAGRFAVPVVLGTYAEITSPPVTNVAIDRLLFTGPWTPGTMKQYWQEVSFGLFEVTGKVYDWVPLSQTEGYYTGGVYQGLYPGYSKTGQMIREILVARDAEVDFGAYDNDGPDGVPNSGDDDGYVDVLLVVHPTYGAECDNTAHMWSHSWRYSSWPESGGHPYATNDPAAGGGTIRIDDYIIVPALSCGTGMIEIGVVCHEMGHAIGLPDLYDYNGGGNGIGFWGLMGAGNWNTPSSPAHLDVWCREQLGWLNPIEIDWRPRDITLRPVETNADAVKLPLPTKRFARNAYATGNSGLVCGYLGAEAGERGWPGLEGYGNGWRESMIREFEVGASRPVTLRYDVWIDAEIDFDFGMIVLERGGTADTLARYTGKSARSETIDLGARLPAGACSFTLRFLFVSDESWSDEDGYYNSQGGHSFTVDNVRITGGGLDYSTDFELDAGGWRFDGESAEYFIAENRRRIGFDANLRGQGMLVYHAENSIAWTDAGNSGGSSNGQCRGLVVEEADGQYNLLVPSFQGGNYGDTGDPFPGSTDNRSFGPTTVPRSHTNGGRPTRIAISGISVGSSGSVSATFAGGMSAPSIASVEPDTIDKLRDGETALDIRGAGILYGAGCALASGSDTVRATSVEWLGENRIVAVIPVEGLFAGAWSLVVASGDGQTASLARAVAVVSVYRTASVAEGARDLVVSWTLEPIEGIRGCLLYRSSGGAPFAPVTADTLRGDDGAFSFRDELVELGVDYSYRIVTYLDGGVEEPYVLAGPYRIGVEPSVLNYPNPFNAGTTIRFFVPERGPVEVDVYDVSGKRVDRVVAGERERGAHEIVWRPAARGFGAGVYFCVFRSGVASRTVKMIYVP